MADQIDSTAVPPLPHRRPRVREVSSRFMSPLIPSNSYAPTSTPDIRRSKSAYRRHLPQTGENLISVANHNSDVSAASTAPSVQKKQYQQRAKFQKHALPNGHHPHTDGRVPPMPDTPAATGAERIVPSRHRLVPNAARRSNSLNSIGNGAATMAARLLQQATSDALISNSDDFESRSGNASNQASSSCPNSPLCAAVNSIEDHNCKNYSKIRSSLNFSSSVEVAGGDLVSRRPHPPSSGIGLAARKVNKVADRVEDEHFLKMSSNRWLQWRFVNAKAEVCLRAQKQEVEKKLWSLGSKISDIRDNVKRKCRDFALLQEMKTLNAIVEAQMPYLDEWFSLEGDYSDSLSGTANALLTSSARLPVSNDIRVDAGRVGEALSSAIDLVEMITPHIQRFMHESEQMDSSILELARIVDGERVHIEECCHMLSKTHSLQMTDCSLRGSLMQSHYNQRPRACEIEEAILR